MIVQLRGSKGAGKSTTVRRLLREHDAVEVDARLWRCNGDLFVPGRYRLDGPSPGTGGDRLADDTVRSLAQRHQHLLWEGMTASTTRPKDWQREHGVVQAFITLTADQTIDNIYRRREERDRNVGRSLNERVVRNGHASISALADKLQAEGWPLVRLTFGDDLYEQLHDLLTDRGWSCDRHSVTWRYDWERRRRVRVGAV